MLCDITCDTASVLEYVLSRAKVGVGSGRGRGISCNPPKGLYSGRISAEDALARETSTISFSSEQHVQGDPDGFALPFVDIKLKVAF